MRAAANARQVKRTPSSRGIHGAHGYSAQFDGPKSPAEKTHRRPEQREMTWAPVSKTKFPRTARDLNRFGPPATLTKFQQTELVPSSCRCYSPCQRPAAPHPGSASRRVVADRLATGRCPADRPVGSVEPLPSPSARTEWPRRREPHRAAWRDGTRRRRPMPAASAEAQQGVTVRGSRARPSVAGYRLTGAAEFLGVGNGDIVERLEGVIHRILKTSVIERRAARKVVFRQENAIPQVMA